jgi:HTH-type transcriptional regulator/antitoxin HigA
MATAAWLRIGEVEAASVKTAPFDRARFQSALLAIRTLMVRDPKEFDPEMRRLLAESGVALVTVPEVKGCHAHGAARWLSPTKALVQLSVRYKWEDIFWFSLFHEAGHILLHGKRSIFIESAGEATGDEEEADRFAAQLLIAPTYDNELLRIRDLAGAVALARKLEIPPGIVIGRLQKEGLLGYNVGHDYRRKFDLVPVEAAQ